MKVTLGVQNGKPAMPRWLESRRQAEDARNCLMEARDLMDAVELRMREVAQMDGGTDDANPAPGSVKAFPPPPGWSESDGNWGIVYKEDPTTRKPVEFADWQRPRNETNSFNFSRQYTDSYWQRSLILETKEGPCRLSECLQYNGEAFIFSTSSEKIS